MNKLSVVIPAYKEPYLQNTIDDLFEKADSEIEVIVVLDGWWPDKIIKDRPNLILVHNTARMGMRSSINQGARIATGKYLMKCDAHCAFAYGFDAILKTDCGLTFTLVPARYGLDVKSWQKTIKKFDHQYIEKGTLKGRTWKEKELNLNSYDLMTTQGSCWFMHKDRFFELGGLDDINYGGMGREAQEISLKTWLSGGRMILKSNVWYAHWDKPKEHVITNKKDKQKSIDYAVDFWMNDRWPLAKRKLSWLIEKFAPVPTWEHKKNIESKQICNVETVRFIKHKFGIKKDQAGLIKLKGYGRRKLYKLFNELGFKTGCEVGVNYGYNAEVMFQEIKGLHLFLVDPYKEYVDQRIKRSNKSMQQAKIQALEKVRDYNYTLLETFSDIAAADFENGSLDFVYIDGNHRFDFVMLDIIKWVPKVRIGGIVAGHDYYHSPKVRVEVKPAVKAYIEHHKISPLYKTDPRIKNPYRGDRTASWFWVKT